MGPVVFLAARVKLRSTAEAVLSTSVFDMLGYIWYYYFRIINTIPTASNPKLKPGRVYRTREFARWGVNAPRLANRLVRECRLVRLAHGLFAHPSRSRFGTVPPTDGALVRAFLDGSPFVFTGA